MLKRALPDVTSDLQAEMPSTLQWVGMENIAIPISLHSDEEKLLATPAKANVFVSLDKPEAKGIHMSRLHKLINELSVFDCNKDNIEHLLNEIVESQDEIGHQAKIELTLNKPALLSDCNGKH